MTNQQLKKKIEEIIGEWHSLHDPRTIESINQLVSLCKEFALSEVNRFHKILYKQVREKMGGEKNES